MHKNLPKVFAVPINKKINNNKETFTSLERKSDLVDEKTISKTELNRIFNAKNHVYKSKLRITTRTETKEYDIVGMTNTSLLTLDGKKLDLEDILEIKKVS